MRNDRKLIIVGGGLSGLTLAYLLHKKNLSASIVEASSRLGGRIQTVSGQFDTPLELGATWFSDVNPNLTALLDQLGLKNFRSFRVGFNVSVQIV